MCLALVAYGVDQIEYKLYGVTSGSLNLHTFAKRSVANELTRRLNNCFEKLAKKVRKDQGFNLLERASKLALAIPGVSSPRDLAVAEKAIGQSSWRRDTTTYRVVDDTYVGLIAGAFSTRGICAFAGTGASVFVLSLIHISEPTRPY